MANTKYRVFRYIKRHGNRVSCDVLEKKFRLVDNSYLTSLAGTLNDGKELRIYGDEAELTAEGIEYVDQFNRDRWFPVITAIIGTATGSVVGALAGYFLRLL